MTPAVILYLITCTISVGKCVLKPGGKITNVNISLLLPSRKTT